MFIFSIHRLRVGAQALKVHPLYHITPRLSSLFAPREPLQIPHQPGIQRLNHFYILDGQGADEHEQGGAENEEDEAGDDEQRTAGGVPKDARQGGDDEGEQEAQGEAKRVFARQVLPEEGQQQTADDEL